MTLERSKLRADKYTFLLTPPNINRDFLSFIPSALITSLKDFVLGNSKSKSSTTVTDLDFNFKVRADRLANFLTFLLSF